MITIIEKKNEIEKLMLAELASHGMVNPSPDYVLIALKGMLESWNEDGSTHPEKQSWVTALEMLIVNYKVKVFLDKH